MCTIPRFFWVQVINVLKSSICLKQMLACSSAVQAHTFCTLPQIRKFPLTQKSYPFDIKEAVYFEGVFRYALRKISWLLCRVHRKIGYPYSNNRFPCLTYNAGERETKCVVELTTKRWI